MAASTATADTSLLSPSTTNFAAHSPSPSQSLLPPRPSLISRQRLLYTSYVIHVINNIAYTLINSFYPHEADRVNATETEVGFVFCAFAVPIFTFAPLFGLLSHRVGYKLILVIGLALEGCCLLCFCALPALTGTTFILISLVLRFVEGIGSALAQTGCYALLAAESTEHGSAMGIMELMGGLGQMFGPLIGGALYDARGFDFPFIIAGSTFLVLCAFTWWIMPSRKLIAADIDIDFLIRHSETATVAHMSSRQNLPANVRASMGVGNHDNGPRVTLRDVLMCRSVPYSCLVALSALCMNSYLGPTLEPHLSNFDVSQVLVGFFFMMASICYTITSPISGRLADRYGTKTPMLGGLALIAFALCLMGPSPLFTFLPHALWMQGVGLGLLGTGVAMAVVPTFSDMIAASAHLGDGAASVVAGLSASIFALGEILGPLTGSALSDHYSFPWASTLFAGMCVSVLFLAVLLVGCGIVEWVPGSRAAAARRSSMDNTDDSLSPVKDEKSYQSPSHRIPPSHSSPHDTTTDATRIDITSDTRSDDSYDMMDDTRESESEEEQKSNTKKEKNKNKKKKQQQDDDEVHVSLLDTGAMRSVVAESGTTSPISPSSPSQSSLTDSPVYIESPTASQ